MANNFATFQIRSDTLDNWLTNNPRLKLSEIVGDLTSGKLKLGNGRSTFKNLPYLYDDIYDILKALIDLMCNIDSESGSKILNPVDTIEALMAKYPTSIKGDVCFIRDAHELYYYVGARWVKCQYDRTDDWDVVSTYNDLDVQYPSPKIGTLVFIRDDAHYYVYADQDGWVRLKNSKDTINYTRTLEDLTNSIPAYPGEIIYVVSEGKHYFWTGSEWELLASNK